MKIYFTHSHQLSKDISNKIVEYLENFDHQITVRNHPNEITQYDSEEARTIFEANVKKIKKADIIIAELSFISSGVGYEISLGLDEKKPVLVLYNMKEDKDDSSHIWSVPVHIKGNTSRYLLLKEYDSRILEKSIELGLKDAKGLINSKFILIIPPDIDHYLEWCVKERGMAKAAATREALKLMMKRSEDYQESLKSN